MNSRKQVIKTNSICGIYQNTNVDFFEDDGVITSPSICFFFLFTSNRPAKNSLREDTKKQQVIHGQGKLSRFPLHAGPQRNAHRTNLVKFNTITSFTIHCPLKQSNKWKNRHRKLIAYRAFSYINANVISNICFVPFDQISTLANV